MHAINECNELEFEPFILYCYRTALPSHFKLYSCRVLCFTLAVCRDICIFSQSVHFTLLVRFCHVLFCFVVIFFLYACVVYVSVTFSVVLLQPVAKWSIHLPNSCFRRQFTLLTRNKHFTSMLTLPFSILKGLEETPKRPQD